MSHFSGEDRLSIGRVGKSAARNVSDSRLRVGIVGGGRVGSALGVALERAGHQVVAVSAISAPSLRRLEDRLPHAAVVAADEVVARADAVLLAVPDDALALVVRGLADTGVWRPGQIVVHVSGAHGLKVLAPAAQARALPLALHPVMAFTGRGEDLSRLVGISYGVTAPEELRPVAEALVVEMEGEPVWIPDDKRPLYHAALTIGANYVTTVVAEAGELLQQAGVAQPAVMLGPLLGAALDNGLRLGDAGQTGPVVRGDARTVAAHIETLRAQAPDAVSVYVALARRTADRALAAGRLSAADAEPLLEVLATHREGTSA